jgi:hypothetical protein
MIPNRSRIWEWDQEEEWAGVPEWLQAGPADRDREGAWEEALEEDLEEDPEEMLNKAERKNTHHQLKKNDKENRCTHQ